MQWSLCARSKISPLNCTYCSISTDATNKVKKIREIFILLINLLTLFASINSYILLTNSLFKWKYFIYSIKYCHIKILAYTSGNFVYCFYCRLAERLLTISQLQRLKADLSVLMALCDKTENDIRSCLSVLQFVRYGKYLLLFLCTAFLYVYKSA